MPTKSEIVDADVTALLKARCTLIWMVTREEMRVERAIFESAAAAGYETRYWDVSAGLVGADGRVLDASLSGDPSNILRRISETASRTVYVLRDFHAWLDGATRRQLRTLARNLQASGRDEARAIVILTPIAEVPPELAGHAITIDYPLPERAEVAKILDQAIEQLPEKMRAEAAPNGTRDAAIEAAVGLSAEEAANCYAKSLVTLKRIDPASVASEKRRVIAREKVLTWYEPDPRGLDAVGGLELLKAWLTTRKSAFGAAARAYGLPAPKGLMLAGVPGCGKSLTAKCVGTAWGVPLLRLDLGALRSKYVGESEANVRRALSTAEAVAPCVLWIEEIEKALAGSTGAQGDGGVAADALGAVLSWMQERVAPVFVLATANDVTGLPPELLRKGRFDDLFFVDLPTTAERVEIIKAAMKQRGRGGDPIDAVAVAKATAEFTGSEVAELVPDAMFRAFNDGARGVTTEDLVGCAGDVIPLSKTAADKVAALRGWAKGRARPASATESTSTAGPSRVLDV